MRGWRDDAVRGNLSRGMSREVCGYEKGAQGIQTLYYNVVTE